MLLLTRPERRELINSWTAASLFHQAHLAEFNKANTCLVVDRRPCRGLLGSLNKSRSASGDVRAAEIATEQKSRFSSETAEASAVQAIHELELVGLRQSLNASIAREAAADEGRVRADAAPFIFDDL